jgi:hypothetical protein
VEGNFSIWLTTPPEETIMTSNHQHPRKKSGDGPSTSISNARFGATQETFRNILDNDYVNPVFTVPTLSYSIEAKHQLDPSPATTPLTMHDF